MSTIQDILPLSPMQEGMLYNAILSEQAYFVEHSFEISGNFKIEAIKRALDRLVMLHEPLRSRVVYEDVQRPVQVILSNVDLELASHIITGDWDEDVAAWKSANRNLGFDFKKLLWRVDLLRQGNQYWLVWSYHHIILDGWSFASVLEDFFKLYNDERGGDAFVPGVRKSLKEYNTWLTDHSGSDEGYWKKYVDQYSEVSHITPFVSKRASSVAAGLHYHISKLDDGATKGIDTFCKTAKVTPNTFFQVAWGILLSKHNDTNDVIFGSAVSGRSPRFDGSESLVGMFVNTIPIRIRYTSSETVLDILKRFQVEFLDGHDHHHVSLNQILKSSIHREKLFDHVTIFENYPVNEEIIDSVVDVQIDRQDVYTRTNLPLTIEFNRTDTYAIIFGCDISTIDVEAVRTLSMRFESVCKQIIKNNYILVKDIMCLSDFEFRKYTSFVTNAKQLDGNNIVKCFERQVRLTPHNIAIVDQDSELSYAEFNKRTNQLANLLIREYNIMPGDIVGVAIDRSALMIVAIMSVLKCGCAYVPINPEFPEYRIKTITEDTGLKLLICNERVTSSLTNHNYFSLPASLNILDQESDQIVSPRPIQADDLAYVLFTSGSTGFPKGVMIDHGGVLNMALSQINIFGIKSSDRVLQFAPFTFDAIISEIFTALFSGASVVLLSKDFIADPEAFILYCESKDVTVATLPPTFLSNFNSEQLSFLSVLISAGEPLNPELANRLFRSVRLFNAYGPTEFTVCASVHEITGEQNTTIPIGAPIDNVFIVIHDSNGMPMPDGCVGELNLYGVGLSRGYLNNPELTCEKFLTDSLGRKFYRSGDLGIALPGNIFEFVGRSDQQLKVRGHRVEPAEIEFQLMQFPQVKSCVVLQDESQLVAFVEAVQSIDVLSLQAFLIGRLPAYMVPNRTIAIQNIPLTDHGKIDRIKLLSFKNGSDLSTKSSEDEVTELQVKIRDAWKEVLRVNTINLDDDFFQLGGDSLLSIRLIAKLNKSGFRFTVKDLLQFPTIALLAKKSSPKYVHRSDDYGTVPLTAIQKYYFQQIRRQQTIERVPFCYTVKIAANNPIDPHAFREALDILLKQHEVFSYWYEHVGDAIIQQSHPYGDRLDIPVVKVVDRGNNNFWQSEIQRLESQIDVFSGEMYKISLYEDTCINQVIFVFHHLIMDNISLNIFLDQLSQLTYAPPGKHKDMVPNRTSSFRQWARSISLYSNSEECLKEIPYWNSVTKGSAGFKLVEDVVAGEYQMRTFSLTEDLTSSLISVRNNGIQEILLTGLMLTIRDIFNKHRIVVQSEGHGRESVIDVDVSNTIGWFTSLFPVALDITTSGTTAEALQSIQTSLANIPNHGFGYLLLKYLTDKTLMDVGSLDADPQVGFNFDGVFEDDGFGKHWRVSNEGIEGRGLIINQSIIIQVNALVFNKKLVVTVDYNSSAFSDELMGRFLEVFQRHLIDLTRLLEGNIFEEKFFSQVPKEVVREWQEVTEIEDLLPLSGTQQGLLYQHLLNPLSRFYHVQSTFRLTGNLNVDFFIDSLNILAKNHEVFRTSFRIGPEGRPVQIIGVRSNATFSYHDLNETEDDILTFQRADFEDHFEILSNRSLIRVLLLKEQANSYVCIWSFHHILMDAWCLEILIKNLLSIYRTLLDGNIPKPQQGPRLRKYFEWLSQNDEALTLQRWEDYLKNFRPVSIFKRNGEKDSESGFDPKRFNLTIKADKLHALRKIAKEHGVSLYTTIEVVWGILLAKYSDTNDVVFGKILTGRPDSLEEVEDMIGLFVNVVPLRILSSHYDSFEDLLKTVQNGHMFLKDNQYVSLAEIQQSISAQDVLFDHIVEFESVESSSSDWISVGLEANELSTWDQVHYDANVIFKIGINLECEIKFSNSNLDEAFYTKMLNHFEYVIDQIIEMPKITIRHIKLLRENEERILVNGPDNPIPNKALHEYVADVASEFPTRIALVHGQISISYKELCIKADIFGYLLQQNNIRPGSLVPVLSSRSLDLVFAFVGILKHRCAYIPLDPSIPIARTVEILQDCRPSLIAIDSSVVNQELLEYLEEKKIKKIHLSEITETYAEQKGKYSMMASSLPSTQDNGHFSLSDLAYVIYTSGSTGKPKGAMIEHKGMMNHLHSKISLCQLDATDVVVQNAPHTFDISIWQFLAALMVGGKVVVIDNETIQAPDKFIHTLIHQHVTVLEVVPSYLSLLLETLGDNIDKSHLSTLKCLMVTGEKPSVSLIKNWIEDFPNIPIINAYGPTETSDDVTHARISKLSLDRGVSIGNIIQNTRIYVLDRDQNVCPPGLEGEIFIGGIGVGRGYLNDVDKTADSFVPDLYFPEEKMYKTGDIGRYFVNGEIEFIGRKDYQVKVRGQRIELQEIEHNLLLIEGIEMAAVILTGEKHDPIITAYIVLSIPSTTGLEIIRSGLEKKLPAYMIPQEIIVLEKFPLTSHGKIDRSKLSMYSAPSNLAEAPRTNSELDLQKIWSEVLNKKVNSIQADFFAIGGHSLKAIQVITRINRFFGTKFTIRDLFENSTIAALATKLVTGQSSMADSLVAMEDSPFYQASHGQRRLWIMNQISEQKNVYNISTAVKLTGAVSRTGLQDAFLAIIVRHEVLRTNFRMQDGEVVQIITPNAKDFQVGCYDLGDDEKKEDKLELIARNLSQVTFDLEKGNLIHADLVKMSSNSFVLILVMHHIISDAWSMLRFTEELIHIYNSIQTGSKPLLASLKIQYRDFAHWQNQKLSSASLEHQLFWQQYFGGKIPVLNLPCDYTRPAIKTSDGDTYSFVIEGKVLVGIREICTKTNTTTFAVLMTALNILFHKYTDQKDIVVGFTSAGRDHPDLEDQLGYFTNTVPLRTVIDTENSLGDVLKQTQKNILVTLDHEIFPFDKIVELLSFERDSGRSPIFDVLVEYQNFQDLHGISYDTLTNLHVDPYKIDLKTSKFDLTFFFEDSASSLDVLIEYNTSLFKRSRIENNVSHFLNVLDSMCGNLSLIIRDVDIVSENEKSKLKAFNNTVTPFSNFDSIRNRIEEVVRVNPKSIALSDNDQRYTYSDMYEQASDIATLLRTTYRVNDKDIVPLLLPRSNNLVISMLGILLADCAFLNLNVLDPISRKRFILNEIDAKVLIIDSRSLFDVQEFYTGEVLVIDTLERQEKKSKNYQSTRAEDGPAYVMYTSGSTGQPKGVKIGWKSFNNYIAWASKYYFEKAEDYSFAVMTNHAFDLTLTSIFCPLVRGEVVYLFDLDLHTLLPSFFEQDRGIRSLKITPSHLTFLQNVKTNAGNIKVLILGGEAVRKDHLDLIRSIDPMIKVFNEYGPTETTIGCTVELLSNDAVTVGVPIANTEIHIIDEHQNLKPIGCFGELCVSGVALALGYVNSSLEKNKFITLDIDGKLRRGYRTGDRGRWLSNGKIELQGRLDRQVKINGFRVELDAIEFALAQYPGIDQAAVIARDFNGVAELFAYYTSADFLDAENIILFLESSLAKYAIPQQIFLLDQIPLTLNGKTDYSSLPFLVPGADNETSFEAPENEIEIALAEIWCDILGLKAIGINDDFFKIGGNSLKVIQLVNAYDKIAKNALRVPDVFNSAILRDLARVIQERSGIKQSSNTSVEYDL